MKKFRFANNKQGRQFISVSRKLHYQMNMKKANAFEAGENIINESGECCKTFCLHGALIKQNQNFDPTRIFNIDECTFTMRIMILGRLNGIFHNGNLVNPRELKLKGTIEHVTLIPVVSVAAKPLTSHFILPDVEAK